MYIIPGIGFFFFHNGTNTGMWFYMNSCFHYYQLSSIDLVDIETLKVGGIVEFEKPTHNDFVWLYTIHPSIHTTRLARAHGTRNVGAVNVTRDTSQLQSSADDTTETLAGNEACSNSVTVEVE